MENLSEAESRILQEAQELKQKIDKIHDEILADEEIENLMLACVEKLGKILGKCWSYDNFVEHLKQQ